MRLLPALVNEVARQCQITRLPCGPLQFYKRKLYLLMAGITALLLRTAAKAAVNAVRIAAHHIQQRAFAGGLKMCNRRLNQMAGAVKLVRVAQVCPAPLQAGPLRDNEVRVEIPVRLLRARKARNDCIELRVQLRIKLRGKRVSGGFDPLGNI